MFSLLKDYLESHNVLIRYVRNIYGYKIGVVVAIGKDKIGYSMVNHEDDYLYLSSIKVHQLPAIQQMVHYSEKMGKPLDILSSKVYKVFAQEGQNGISIPKFNREEGVRRAIEDAENEASIHVVPDVDTITLTGRVPKDHYMVNALVDMVERSRKVKRFQ